MAGKSIPISVRISDDDAAFLASLQIAGAATPSEKIRALIARARDDAEGGDSYEATLARLRAWMEPAAQRLRAREMASRQRSELIADTQYWLPDLMAFLAAGPEPAPRKGDDGLVAFEAGVADRIFRFIEAVLRLAVTEKAPCYDPGVVSAGMAGTLELTGVVSARRQSKGKQA